MSNINWNPFDSPVFRSVANTAGGIVTGGGITNLGDIGKSVSGSIFGSAPAQIIPATTSPALAPAQTIAPTGAMPDLSASKPFDMKWLLYLAGAAIVVFAIVKLAGKK